VAQAVEQQEAREQEPPVVEATTKETILEVPPIIVDISSLLSALIVTVVRSTL
jgi:hypothetical protein